MRRGILKPKIAAFAYTLFAALILSALIGVNSAEAKEGIVLCTIDDLSGDFSIMATPKTYGYRLAVKEVNDAGGIMVDGEKKMINLITYDGQSQVKRYQELSQKCIS